jgi:hypothetical protein
MADSLLYEMSSSQQLDGEPFSRRDLLYVVDSNNGSYQGVNQLIYDTASLANSGRWVSMSEGFLEVPLVIVLSGANATANIDDAAGADFICALKNGHHQIINSISVELNNTSIIQQTNLTNAHISYRLNTQMSVNDVELNGATIGYYPDTAQSWEYSNAAGSQNNRVNPVLGAADSAYDGEPYNAGLYRRQTVNAFNTSKSGVSILHTNSEIQQFNKSRVYPKARTGTTDFKVWQISAIIRLKDLHPFFGAVPLQKGAYYKFYINLNQSVTSFTATTVSTETTYTVAPTGVSIFGGGTNPLMLCKNGAEPLDSGHNYKASVSVVTPVDSEHASLVTAVGSMQTSTRLYVPAYTMNPTKEKSYLEMNRTKTIKYNDIYQYQFRNNTSSFSILVSNGISKLKNVVILPILSRDGTVTTTASGLSPIASPLASEPATCSPLQWVKDFNVQISGVNAFVNNLQFGYEQFLTELSQTGVNGNLTTGLCSGLISRDAFEQTYGYLLVDCSRRLGQAFVAPASVQLTGTVAGNKPVDLIAFCEFEREITVDTFTGDVIGA